MINSKQSQFQPCGNTELVEDVTQMMLHSVLGHSEVVCNLSIREGCYDCRHDLNFARG
jgi:hypothetical protein